MFELGNSQTTMIGSLPHVLPAEALAALAAHPLGIPAWPQLPKRSFKESMVLQYSEGFPGIAVDEKNKRVWVERNDRLLEEMAVFYEAVVNEETGRFAISDDYAAGMHAFLGAMGADGRKLPVAKGQVVGPFTFGLGLNDGDGKAVWFDEQYRDIVLKGLTMKAVWLAMELKKIADLAVIFLDEPIFSALGTPAYLGIENETVVDGLNEIAAALHSHNVKIGVHCCGNMEWPLLSQSDIDIIAFDAYGYGDRLTLYPDAISEFLERGGLLAWGMAPTGSSESIMTETPETLLEKTITLEKMFTNKGVSLSALRARRLFTPSCGMGNLSKEEAARVLKTLFELSAGARALK